MRKLQKRVGAKTPPLVGIKEVAMRAGVGTGSVSRVFSGQAGVSEQMRKRVLRAAESLNYAPNMLAQAMRSRFTRSVGFVVSDLANPLISSIVQAAEAVLSAAGYSVLLTDSGNQAPVDAKRIRLLQQRRVDGLILLPSTEDDPEFLAALARGTVPIVVIDRSLPAGITARYVLSDHHTGVSSAARNLLTLGHRKLAIIVGRDIRPTRERIRAVKDTIVESKLRPTLVVAGGSLSIADSAAAMTDLLNSPDPPTAVIVGGNQFLEGALSVVRSKKLRLGHDLSLVTCDDIPLGRFFETPISAVMRDTNLMGQTAAHLLLESISEPYRPARTLVLPTWYEPRSSCGRLRRNKN